MGGPHLHNVVSHSEKLKSRGELETVSHHLHSPQSPRETGGTTIACDHTKNSV